MGTIGCEFGLNFKAIIQMIIFIAVIWCSLNLKLDGYKPWHAGLVSIIISTALLIFAFFCSSFHRMSEQGNFVLYFIAFQFMLAGFIYTIVRISKRKQVEYQIVKTRPNDIKLTDKNEDMHEIVHEKVWIKDEILPADRIYSVIVMITNLVMMFVTAFLVAREKIGCSFALDFNLPCCCGSCFCIILLLVAIPLIVGHLLRKCAHWNGFIALFLIGLAILTIHGFAMFDFQGAKITLTIGLTFSSLVFAAFSQIFDREATPSVIALSVAASIPLLAINIL